MTHLFQRICSGLMHGFHHQSEMDSRIPLSTIKQSLETLLDDCEPVRADRVVYQIKLARTPSELWYLRYELHQCISYAHSQSEASRRLNSLMSVFAGWVAPQKLTEIQ
jgi:hypothetical protein